MNLKKDVAATTYRRYFKHWRSGKTYDAHDYGLKAWPIGKSAVEK